MKSSKNFTINDGSQAGVFCSYCGKKITPAKDEESGGFYSRCDCADAKAEIVLLTQQEELDAKIDKFYQQREKKTKKTQLFAHKTNMESQLKELSAALAELDDETEEAGDNSPRRQLEEIGNPLKMTGPKLPKFEN